MATKVNFLQTMLWKIKCSGFFKTPPAFWFGFWFVFGAYWALILIGWISHIVQMLHELAGS